METKNYAREFTGSDITVIAHSNQLYINLKGSVVEETARTFRIDVEGKIKTVPKTTGEFTISSGRFELRVKGNSILMRPEERLKNLRRIIRDEKKGDDYN